MWLIEEHARMHREALRMDAAQYHLARRAWALQHATKAPARFRLRPGMRLQLPVWLRPANVCPSQACEAH